MPNHSSIFAKEVLQIDHRSYSVEEEAEEMGKCTMRNTINGPGTVMVHLRYASDNIYQAYITPALVDGCMYL